MKLEFAGPSSRDTTHPMANTSRLLNCYREPVVAGGRGPNIIRAVPGMRAVANLDRVFARAVAEFDGAILTNCGGDLFSVTADGTATNIGAVGNSIEAGISVNTGYATIVGGGEYRTWDGTTLSLVATGAVTDVGSVAYLGGYTIVSELNGRRLQWSALADPNTFSGLDFASAEISEDPIVRIEVVRDVLIVFKASGFELWGVTGRPGPDAFQRISGAMEEPGLAGFNLVAGFPGGLAFIGEDGRIYAWAGGLRVISTPAVEVALTEDQAEGVFFYERRGHGFICIAFRNRAAWCYDTATGEWHERGEGEGPWLARKSLKLDGTWYVVTNIGKIAALEPLCRDYDALMRREITSYLVDGPFSVGRLTLFPRTGEYQQEEYFVLDDGEAILSDDGRLALGESGPASGPEMIGLRTSRDGVTFGTERSVSLGNPGQYDQRVEFRALGQFRHQAAFQVILSGPFDVPILSVADLEVAR